MSQTTMKYPVSVQNFELFRNDNFVYVNKTDLICPIMI